MKIEEGKFYFIKDEFFEYIVEKYIKQKRDVKVNKDLQRELKRKSNKILKLIEKGYKNLVFPDILKIREVLINEK